MLAFAERGGCVMNLEDRQAFEHGLEIGRGGIWLCLTEEQYAALKMGRAKRDLTGSGLARHARPIRHEGCQATAISH